MLRKDPKSMYWGVAPCWADIIFVTNKKSRGCFWRSTAFAFNMNATGSDYLSSTPKGTCIEYVCFPLQFTTFTPNTT